MADQCKYLYIKILFIISRIDFHSNKKWIYVRYTVYRHFYNRHYVSQNKTVWFDDAFNVNKNVKIISLFGNLKKMLIIFIYKNIFNTETTGKNCLLKF